MHPIGILGGTFDPVHIGHLRAALEVQHHLNLQQVRFIPCQIPVHKAHAKASTVHRLAMLKLALAPHPSLYVDEREIQRATPSYMFETLASLRQEFPQIPLCLLLGQDAFASFSTWHRWQELLQFAHFIIMNRPQASLPTVGPEAELLAKYQIHDPSTLTDSLAGKIYCQTITALEISSTMIRQQIKQGLAPNYLIPDVVLQYLQQNKIYS